MPTTTRNQAKVLSPHVEAPVISNTDDPSPDPDTNVPPDSPSPADSDEDDPAQPTTRKEKGHKRSQSSISICNVSDQKVVTYFGGWQARLEALFEEAKQHGIDIYAEVRSVAEAAERSFAIVKSVKEYKKKDGNAQRNIKVIAFSDATVEDLQRLSWDNIMIIDFNALLASVKLQTPADRKTMIISAAPDLRRVLEELDEFVGSMVESGTRISIDQWLIAARRILKKDLEVFVWTELILSSSKKQPVYIEEEKGNKTTFLTGIIDYGLATIPSQKFGAVYQQIKSIGNEVQDIQVALTFRKDHFTFVIIEAKSNRKNLEDHIPQVVLQCIALSRPSKLDIVVFCLANSKRWIFGVVDCSTKHVFHTPEVDFGRRDLLDTLLVFIFWTSTQSGDILSLVKSLVNGQPMAKMP